ncbi:hypothetical protein FQA39_LY00581 [Lamprigera yunnana]|nr:hypothetical protein FQA39_LY00581 [Lamprigera yunnana]
MIRVDKFAERITKNAIVYIIAMALDQFDPDEKDFSSYKERLDNFWTMREIADTTQEDKIAEQSILLGCLRRTQFKQLAAHTIPPKPSEKTYEELLQIL